MKTIEEKNRMIAEFMGDYDFEHTEGGLPLGDFSNSWDWLMPVIGSIEDRGFSSETVAIGGLKNKIISVKIYNTDSVIVSVVKSDSKFRVTYEAVIQFIEWYNENKQDL